MRISIVDCIVVRPGRREEFLSGFHQQYLPGACRRGLNLAGIFVFPAEEFGDQSTDVTIAWTLPDYRAFFAMRAQAGADPSVTAFWQWCDGLLERRERRVGTAVDEASAGVAAGAASPT